MRSLIVICSSFLLFSCQSTSSSASFVASLQEEIKAMESAGAVCATGTGALEDGFIAYEPSNNAKKAGIRRGDRVLSFGGVSLEDGGAQDKMQEHLNSIEVGTEVPIVIVRDGETMEFAVPTQSQLSRVQFRRDLISRMNSRDYRGALALVNEELNNPVSPERRINLLFYKSQIIHTDYLASNVTISGPSPSVVVLNMQMFRGELEAMRVSEFLYKERRDVCLRNLNWFENNGLYREAAEMESELAQLKAYYRSGRTSPPNERMSPPAEGIVGAGSTKSSGTGFAVKSDGLILTAFHVIEGAQRIKVTFEDGRTYPATLEVANRSNDLALLKVDAVGLKALYVATTDSAGVGAEVFTLGYPATGILGQEPKYTNGVISAKSGIQGEASLLQVTVPIQPGNSGGPIVTEKGQVVGVVTSTAAVSNFMRATGSLPQNINWAIKSDYARLMFTPGDAVEGAGSLDEAIQRARGAICFIEAWADN